MLLDDDFEVPVDVPEKALLDSTVANEQAFYTSTSLEVPEAHDDIRKDLENKGSNDFHTAANEAWRAQQDFIDNNFLLSVVEDSTMPIEEKKALVELHTKGTNKSTNIRDQFILDTASNNVSPIDKIDIPIRNQDIEAQDLFIDTVESRKEAHNELQRLQTAFAGSLNSSAGSVIGGILMDFLPFALPNFRNAAAAKEAGLELDVSSVIASGSETESAINNLGASFLASGSLNRKVADAFDAAPPEQKIQIFKDVLNGLDKVPGTDFNKFLALQELIEQPLHSDILTGGRNLLSVLEAHPLGQLITNPIRTIKWYTTFTRSTASATPGATQTANATTDEAGNTIIPLDTFLPNHNAILPKPKQARPTRTTPESVQPSNDVISLGDKFDREFPAAAEKIETSFAQPSTGYGRGNITDTPIGSDPVSETITAERVVNDFVEGQNFGDQQAARELLGLAKGITTVKNNQVFVDELWQAAGGADVVSLKDFKDILKDLHVKGSISLGKSSDKISVEKSAASKIVGGNDEELNVLNLVPPAKRQIADDAPVTKLNAFGDDLKAQDLIEKVLARATELPEDIIKRRVNKVYSSSFADKQAGRVLVRVDGNKFDVAFAKSTRYVGAEGVGGSAKKYNRFSSFFDKTANIEVGSVKVAADGSIEFIDGAHRHAVLRDKGISKIPVSMDAESILNAQRNGLLDGIARESVKNPTRADANAIARSATPSVNANSPAGTYALANPVAAANAGVDALADTSGDLAKKLGSSRAEVFGTWVMPKLQKAVEEQFPEVAKKLHFLDDAFAKSFKEASVDPNITSLTELNAEVDLVVETLREIKGATYQQANSTLDFGRNSAHGLAQYGRNADYGFSSLEDASFAYDQILGNNPNFPTRIIQKDNQYFVEQEWEAKFNHLDRFMFGLHSLQANFLGKDVSALARTKLGDHLIPFTMSDTPDLTRVGGAMLNEVKANKIEQQFLTTTNDLILSKGMPLKELHTELRNVQESQKWLSLGELSQNNAHLSADRFEKLVQGYEGYKRLADYNYQWINRIDRSNAERAGHQGIYNEGGQLVGLGTKNFPEENLTNGKIREVWSYDQDKAIPLPSNLEGREVLLARAPVKNRDGDIFQYVIIEGKYEVGILPSRTLPKVEGWVPRKNIENWYVDATPRSAKVNGVSITGASQAGKDALAQHKRTVGAGMTRPEALKLMEKLGKEGKFINDALSIRPAQENVGNASVADYTFFAKTVKSTKKRGERLPTLNGHSKLEEPLVALTSSTRNAINVQAWDEYLSEFKQSFVNKFGEYTKGEFPTHVSQIQPKEAMTELELKEFKVAQRLFNWLSNVQQFGTNGDQVWAKFWHGAADVLENIDVIGAGGAEISRALAKQGNLIVRASKSVATTLFIHTNPLRQWVIQPQQLMELNLISPEYMKQSALDIPAIISALHSKATMFPSGGDTMLYNSARKLSGMSPDEFDEVFEAFFNSGLPQAVDLNSMLMGTLQAGKTSIDPSATEKFFNGVGTVVKSPGTIGKQIGFTPAELANITGTWLFTRQRWLKNNPGQNWNTPENLATITKQAWDISHSMIGNAGVAPWQRGAAGLFLQFAAVQHKGITQKLMSKTLTKDEKIKMTAARLALYGTHGIPFLAVSAGIIVNEFGSEEMKANFPKMEGGFIDMGTNALIDAYSQDEKKKSDIQFSKALTPIPETHPFVELFVEGKRLMFQEGGTPNPRFPGIQALGSLAEAYSDIEDVYTVQELDTAEKLTAWIPEAAEVFSGYNNYAKAKMIKNFGDKKNRANQWMGLELSEAAATAQLFGFTTLQEQNGYLINDIIKEREQFVQEAARDIVDSLTKAEEKFGTPDWDERKRRLQILSTGISDDTRLIDEIKSRVDSMQISQAKKGSFRDTLYYKLFRNKASKKDEAFNEAMDVLRSSAESNPRDKRTLEKLEELMNTTVKKEDL